MDSIKDRILHGSEDEKVVEWITFNEKLDLSGKSFDSDNTHPVVFRDCTFNAGIDLSYSTFRLPVKFEDCELSEVDMEQARFDYDTLFSDSHATAEFNAFEAQFQRDFNFRNSISEVDFVMDEAEFGDDTRFDGSQFKGELSFNGSEFSGRSNRLEDHTTFENVKVAGQFSMEHARMAACLFNEADFYGSVTFFGTHFVGDVEFESAMFNSTLIANEAKFDEDVDFSKCEFGGRAEFKGTVFTGGARTLEDDVSFQESRFLKSSTFVKAEFRYANFKQVNFHHETDFTEVIFNDDAEFNVSIFHGEADFTEVRFKGNGVFDKCMFRMDVSFVGADFRGGTQHISENAVFTKATFRANVSFDNGLFSSANFTETYALNDVSFVGAEFSDRMLSKFYHDSREPVTLDFTDSTIRSGKVDISSVFPTRYDFTEASLGEVEFKMDDGTDFALDYVRFNDTTLNEFDGHEFEFGRYTNYFDRNGWVIHGYRDGGSQPEVSESQIETTYLKAKNAASDGGYIKAAGEFRIQRQIHARNKYLGIAKDHGEDVVTRAKNVSRAAENWFLGITCGHGMRIGRIGVIFAVFPLIPAALYAFGGPFFETSAGQVPLADTFTSSGLDVLYRLIYFSYITFLTIGYGGIGPTGAGARFVAGVSVYMSVILGGLVLYALVKRSEV